MTLTAKRPMRVPLVLLGTLFAAAYFGYHAVYGTHGIQAKARLVERQEEIRRQTVVMEAVRLRLRQDVAALSLDPPPPDLLEEVARSTFGLIRDGDLVVRRNR